MLLDFYNPVMFSILVRLLFPLAFLSFTFTFILPSSQVLSIQPSSSASIPLALHTTSNTAFNTKANTTSPPSNRISFQCDGIRYGHTLRIESCADALDQIPWRTSPYPLSFGVRGMGHYDVQLPFRALSCGFAPLP